MDAAPAIIIESVRLGEGGAVGVPGNQDVMFLPGPMLQALLRLLLACIVFGRAGRVKDSVPLKGFPQISDEEAGKAPVCGIEQIRLMPVGEVNIHGAGGASRKAFFQDDTRVEG